MLCFQPQSGLDKRRVRCSNNAAVVLVSVKSAFTDICILVGQWALDLHRTNKKNDEMKEKSKAAGR